MGVFMNARIRLCLKGGGEIRLDTIYPLNSKPLFLYYCGCNYCKQTRVDPGGHHRG